MNINTVRRRRQAALRLARCREGLSGGGAIERGAAATGRVLTLRTPRDWLWPRDRRVRRSRSLANRRVCNLRVDRRVDALQTGREIAHRTGLPLLLPVALHRLVGRSDRGDRVRGRERVAED